MARAVAESGRELHVWARRSDALRGITDFPFIAHQDVGDLGAASDVVCVCVCSDDDVAGFVDALLAGDLRPGTVVVNHGTGTPANAKRFAEMCADAGVAVLDAPVSGGRPAAEARTLVTMVGGPAEAADRCEPVFRSFSREVVRLGAAGAGQTAKLLNNALMIMNQAAIADIFALAATSEVDPLRLLAVLSPDPPRSDLWVVPGRSSGSDVVWAGLGCRYARRFH